MKSKILILLLIFTFSVNGQTCDKYVKACEDTVKAQDIAIDNLKPYMDRFEFMKMSSENAIKSFAPGSVDYVFVDGDHSYDATIADCELYYPFLKKGGIFCGHDYQALESVKKAVDDFRTKNKITAPINLTLNSAFFWNK
mgnify:CR=1 FL=1